MRNAMLYATIGCAVLWSLCGVVSLARVRLLKDGGSAKEGWVYLVVGAGWALTAFMPELWNLGIPTLLLVAIAWEWDKRKPQSAVKNKVD